MYFGAAVARFDRDSEAVEVKLGIAHLQIGQGKALEHGDDSEILQRLLPSPLQVELARVEIADELHKRHLSG
jgi:hypothetical protein